MRRSTVYTELGNMITLNAYDERWVYIKIWKCSLNISVMVDAYK